MIQLGDTQKGKGGSYPLIQSLNERDPLGVLGQGFFYGRELGINGLQLVVEQAFQFFKRDFHIQRTINVEEGYGYDSSDRALRQTAAVDAAGASSVGLTPNCGSGVGTAWPPGGVL